MRTLIALFISLVAIVSIPAHAEEENKNFTLNTDAFLDQGALPVLYTCDGKDVSPQLDWTNVPAKTQSMALVLKDPDAPKGEFYHWVLYNIPTSLKDLPQGVTKLPSGVIAGKNSWDKPQYNGPCPPKGAAHTYVLTLYALDTKPSIPAGATGKKVMEAINKHVVGKAELTMVYSRWLK